VKTCRLALAVLAAFLVAGVGAASAAPAPNPVCGVIAAQRAAIELPVRVAPGLTVRVRDPYGGVFARNRLFVQFSLRYARPADRARVADVTWLLDGRSPRRDEGGRDAFLAPSTMFTAGPHVITVRITPAGGGAPVEAALQVTATDCRLATIVPRRDRTGGLVVAIDSGGPPLRSATLLGAFLVPHGRRIGTVTAHGRTWTLRSLRITGLPPRTTAVRVHLTPGVARGRLCALAAQLDGGAGPPVRVVPRCSGAQ
jgi:hypothetical protein